MCCAGKVFYLDVVLFHTGFNEGSLRRRNRRRRSDI
jgi:hypothetical protein